MASFERQITVDAPLDRVWAFHSSTDGLRALTPNWMALRIDDIEHPQQGAPNTSTLSAGTEIHASVAPFWVLPRQRFVSVIETREEYDTECSFVDTMRGGPFRTWEHTHRFIEADDGTRIVDHVEYDAPGGSVGDRLVSLGLSIFFTYRHWRTRRILEG